MGRGRPPKCKYCGRKIDRNNCYVQTKTTKKGDTKKLFFCNEEEFLKYNNKISTTLTIEEPVKKISPQKTKQREIYDIVCEIVGIKNISINTYKKEKILWDKIANGDQDLICKYFEKNKKSLILSLTKIEKKEYNRLRYLSAIVKNHLKDFRNSTEIIFFGKDIQQEFYETKYKDKKRKPLIEIEEEYDE